MSGSRWLPNGTPSRSDIATGGGPSPGSVTFRRPTAVAGRNPVAAAVPLGERPPLVIDFATSAVAEGKVRGATSASPSPKAGSSISTAIRPPTPPTCTTMACCCPPPATRATACRCWWNCWRASWRAIAAPACPTIAQRRALIVLDVAAFQPADQFNATTGAYAGVIKALKPRPASKKCCCRASGVPQHRSTPRRRHFRGRRQLGLSAGEGRRIRHSLAASIKRSARHRRPRLSSSGIPRDTTRTDKGIGQIADPSFVASCHCGHPCLPILRPDI